jgi:hypothetical protein
MVRHKRTTKKHVRNMILIELGLGLRLCEPRVGRVRGQSSYELIDPGPRWQGFAARTA